MGLQVGKLQSASLLFAFPGARHRGAPVKEFTISLLFAPPRGASLVAQTVKNPSAMQETQVQFLGWENPLEKEMATHSSILAWRIPWTEEPGGSHGFSRAAAPVWGFSRDMMGSSGSLSCGAREA